MLEEWNWLDLVPKVGLEAVIDPRTLVDSHFGVVLRSLRSVLLLTTAVNRRVRDRTFTKAVLEGFRARISKNVTDVVTVKLMQSFFSSPWQVPMQIDIQTSFVSDDCFDEISRSRLSFAQ